MGTFWIWTFYRRTQYIQYNSVRWLPHKVLARSWVGVSEAMTTIMHQKRALCNFVQRNDRAHLLVRTYKSCKIRILRNAGCRHENRWSILTVNIKLIPFVFINFPCTCIYVIAHLNTVLYLIPCTCTYEYSHCLIIKSRSFTIHNVFFSFWCIILLFARIYIVLPTVQY